MKFDTRNRYQPMWSVRDDDSIRTSSRNLIEKDVRNLTCFFSRLALKCVCNRKSKLSSEILNANSELEIREVTCSDCLPGVIRRRRRRQPCARAPPDNRYPDDIPESAKSLLLAE